MQVHAQYIKILALAVVCISSRGFALGGDAGLSSAPSNTTTNATDTRAATGRVLFLKNCAHCHGADARGNEGPDLHELAFSDDWIANRIRKGKPGEMTAFVGKLQPKEIETIVVYLRMLK